MSILASPLLLIVVAAVIIFVTISALVSRYKRCPSDKILVIYGRTGGSSAKCIHGGGAFIWPVIQDYAYLDLKPLSIEANLTNALSRQNIRVDVPSRFTIAISTEPENMNTAAERLLGLTSDKIQELAQDILFGQLRLVIATMTIEEINTDRDKFLDNISKTVDSELKKVGLRLINVNVTDIRDESGYIVALGKEAAAKAINEAKISVAEQERIGETGKASADKDREINIAIAQKDEFIGKAEADRETRIKTSEANAQAVKGENNAKVEIAQSDADRRQREAEALKLAVASEKVQEAKALEEAYLAEQLAEKARAERERATQNANIVVPAEIEKRKAIIDAEAQAERIRLQAKGEADAIFAKMEAEAKGLFEILSKQAEGYKGVVGAAGGDPTKAFQLLLIEKLPELVKTQVEAVKNLKIDKVTVWDSGNNENGKGSTANFVAGLMKSVPPLNELFNMAGLKLPTYLGEEIEKAVETELVTEKKDEKIAPNQAAKPKEEKTDKEKQK
ncbi:MAG: SPFH domain-containing protein [Paludibacteraceae bacterium]